MQAWNIFIVGLLATATTAPPAESTAQKLLTAQDVSSLIKQRSGLDLRFPEGGWSCRDEAIAGMPESGQATLSASKWLMYLLHWGPIQTKRITVEYVRERMLGMWGVPFDFSGVEGRERVAGHDAVLVEAYGTDKAFYTRFIVWNCAASGREFIADTNYNLMAGTPVNDFELERRSAGTVRCHAGAVTEADAELDQSFDSKDYALAFSYPSRWFVLDSPFYVPFPEYDGVRDSHCGSLLSLCSDQNLQIVLNWKPAVSRESRGNVFMGDPQLQAELQRAVASAQGVTGLSNKGFESFDVGGRTVHRIWGACTVAPSPAKPESDFFTDQGIYQAAQADSRATGKRVTIVLITKLYRYQSVMSTPSRDIHDRFLRDLVRNLE